jgi:uncharacterized protein
MTNEERDVITNFIARVGGGAQAGAPAGGNPWGSAVPATTQPALPPIDREADGLIGELLTRYPEARYRLTQLAFVQEHALAEATNRLQQMQAELQQARQAAQQAQSQPQQGGGFFSGLFGGGQRPPPQPGPAWNQGAPQPQYAPPPQYAPQAQYAPGAQPGMFQRSGSGFLGSALTTAAGVAGGLVVGNALMGLFEPHPEYGGGFGGFGGAPGASPWGAAAGGAAAGGVDQGTWDTSSAPAPDPGLVDQGTWDQPGPSGGDSGSWSDPGGSDPGGDSGGFDSGGGSSDSLC